MREAESRPSRQRAFFFDQRGCIACRACQMACKDLHDLPVGVNWRRVTTFEFGSFPRPEVFHLTMACNHCLQPACIAACPEGALAKRGSDGVVLFDAERCLACLACVDACPYGAIQFDAQTGAAGKCDMCVGFLERGEEPACVAACVMEVLRVGWLDELPEDAIPAGRGLPDPAITDPALRIIPHRHAQDAAE